MPDIFPVLISKFELWNDQHFFSQISISHPRKSPTGFWTHSGELQVIPKIADNIFVMFAFK